jgi:cyclophilin family peptidyl-prolyl cis-trans isomerase
MTIDPEKSYQATISTSLGDMVAFLYPGRAPKTVNNFVNLARYHYYDGLTFHRVISGFMIQGGCPEGSGRGGPGYRFEDELPNRGDYELGSLAMANAGPNTNGSQFFIVSGASGIGLPPSYSLFGKLIAGLDVLEAAQSVSTGRDDRPSEPLVINSIVIDES